jgi:hypothetical protein
MEGFINRGFQQQNDENLQNFVSSPQRNSDGIFSKN